MKRNTGRKFGEKKQSHYWLKIFINLGNVFTRVPVMQLDVANRKTSLYTNVTKEK